MGSVAVRIKITYFVVIRFEIGFIFGLIKARSVIRTAALHIGYNLLQNLKHPWLFRWKCL